MPRFGLIEVLRLIPEFYFEPTRSLNIPNGFLTPGAWVALTSLAISKNISRADMHIPPEIENYASAIGLSRALFGSDDYAYARTNDGKNYSSLENLCSPEATNDATARINGWVRHSVGRELPATFVAELCEVVGDLHDNVWAHGMACGFSMAQKWKVPHDNDNYLEFALADSGLGFLREMQRIGLPVNSDKDAVQWCIQEGHSTKKIRPDDDWAQRVPADVIGNPLKGIAKTHSTDNHHMGLGLAKLIKLVVGIRGELWLASGNAVLTMEPNGNQTYSNLTCPWQGVAIACRFKTSEITKAGIKIGAADKEIEDIMNVLGGRHDERHH